MGIITTIAIIFIVSILYFFLDRNTSVSIAPQIFERVPEYKKRPSVMNGSESAFLFELKKQIPPEYYIFPKMRIADMVYPIHGRGFYNRRNQVLPKHVDFLICDKNFQPKLAIELNGKSHQRQDRIERDERVKQIFEDAKIPLEFINVGSSFTTEISRVISLL